MSTDNDEFYIAHRPGTTSFLFFKMKNKPKTLEETKKEFENLKTDPKSVLFSEEKINKGLFKKLKRSTYLKDKLF